MLVSRETNTTTILAGKPATPGHRNGAFSASEFNTPLKTVALSNETLAVTDGPNKCIRKLDLINDRTSDLKCLDKYDFIAVIFGITMRPGTSDLYFSFVGGLGM